MPVIRSDALHQQEAAGALAVGRDLVRTVRRNGMALPGGEQDALRRAEHRDGGACRNAAAGDLPACIIDWAETRIWSLDPLPALTRTFARCPAVAPAFPFRWNSILQETFESERVIV